MIQIPDQTNFKCVHELECNTLDKIREEVMNWLAEHTDFLEQVQDNGFWKTIEYKSMARACPSLLQYLYSIKTPIREISVGLFTEGMTDGVTLHHDSPPLNFKINFPIYNTQDVWTEWYDIPQHHYDEIKFEDIHDTVDDLYPCLLKYNMHECPIVFNSFIPHRVIAGPSAVYPRIMLATMPINDPINLMLKKG